VAAPRRSLIVVLAGALAAVALAIVVGWPLVQHALLMQDAEATLMWAKSGASGQPVLRVSDVGSMSSANRTAALTALSGDWRVCAVADGGLIDATWVIVQISPDLGSLAGQVTSLRYRQTGWLHYTLEPDSSELLTSPPSTDHQ